MTRQRVRLILLVAISASLGGVAYKVAENIWQTKSRVVQKVAVKALEYLPEAALHIKEFHRAQVEGERKVWEIFGDEAHYLKAKNQLIIQKPRIYFYPKDNNTFEAVGKEGTLWLTEGEQQQMEKAQLLGDVQVNYRGYVLNSNEAFYFKSKNQVVIPGKVTIKGAGMDLDGVDMELNLDDEKMRLFKNVKTKVEPDKIEKTKGQSHEKKRN